jgi:hypothetical protein
VHLDAIRIKNFRRLKEVRVDFEQDLTIFVGPNNSGKTSATHALELFLREPHYKFSIHDFSADCWGVFNQIESRTEVDFAEFPRITLDLWLEVEEADLHRVIDLLPSLDWTGSRIGLRVEFGPCDVIDLLTNYRKLNETAKQHAKYENGTLIYHPWPRSLRVLTRA